MRVKRSIKLELTSGKEISR